MKRFLLIIILILIFYSIFASPADMIPFKVVQPNGDSITIVQYGDEYGTWYETLDGYVVEKDSSNYWVYVNTNTNGNLVLTNQIVNSVSSPTGINLTNVFNTIENNRINAYGVLHNDSIYYPDLEDEETIIAIQQEVEYDTIRAKAPAKNKGTINVLTILIQFQDVKFEQPTAIQDYFDRLMNNENFVHPDNQNKITGSVREYWEEVSYGQLSTNTIVVGPYTADNNIDYYKTERNNENGSINSSKTKKLVKKAIKSASKDVNMQLFDNDNNGFVDFVHVVFAGSNNNIWPHQSAIFGIFRDWVWVSKYIITPEKENGKYASIGTICHEMGHAFGAPDFYDVNFGIYGEYLGTGRWDLMASGNYNDNGNSPAHPNPYIKTEIFGWATATELSGSNRLYTLRASELDKNSIYKLSTSTPGEYYLLENRQGAGLPGLGGLVIYHVNAGIENVTSDKINIKHPQNLYVVDANNHIAKPTGSVDSYGNIDNFQATFWNYYSNNIYFTSTSEPSNCAWNGTPTQNKDVCFISEMISENESFVKFVLNPEIEGPDILCDSAIYSVSNVPAGATIEWDYEEETGVDAAYKTPFFIASGQGTTNVVFKRGTQRTISNGVTPTPGIPILPTPNSINGNITNSTIIFEPYQGASSIYAHITFNGNRYTLEKKVYMPEDLEIDDLGYGQNNPLQPYSSYVFSLRNTVDSNWESNVKWTISDMNGTYTRYGNSVGISTGNSIAVSLRVEHISSCSDTESDSIILPITSNGGLIFQNPASGSIEISVVGGSVVGETNHMQTMALDQPELYQGAYRLELWHAIHGKVREMDVSENTPTVTMNLDGLSSGIYVLRLIIDNQIVETSQMIIR